MAQLKISRVAKVTINKKFERRIAKIFLTISFNICFGCSKEPSQRVWMGGGGEGSGIHYSFKFSPLFIS